MPRADFEHTPTRRKFLGHIAGATAIVAVTAGTAGFAQGAQPGNSDAELIALRAEFDDLQRQSIVVFETIHDDDEQDAALAPLWDGQNDLVDRITELRATTTAGFIALANTLALHSPEMVEEAAGLDGAMLAMLLRGLSTAGAAGGVS
jgi:hypothetical protein